jgi:hypothetical protein
VNTGKEKGKECTAGINASYVPIPAAGQNNLKSRLQDFMAKGVAAKSLAGQGGGKFGGSGLPAAGFAD